MKAWTHWVLSEDARLTVPYGAAFPVKAVQTADGSWRVAERTLAAPLQYGDVLTDVYASVAKDATPEEEAEFYKLRDAHGAAFLLTHELTPNGYQPKATE